MRLALTFDDGPSAWTDPLLDLLAEHDVRAMFFVLGTNIAGREETLQRTAAAGHEIGNHTWSHPLLEECDEAEIVYEIDETTRLIERVTGIRPTTFRAPYDRPGRRGMRLAEARGLEYVSFDIDPGDWRPNVSAEEIARFVLSRARDGAIVDLHDGRPPRGSHARTDCTPTVEAVRLLLASGY